MAAPIVRYYAALTETSVGDVERLWRNAKRTASTEGRKHDWTRISGLLKESLGAGDFRTMGYLGAKVTILDETPDFAVIKFAEGSTPKDESVARTLRHTNGVLTVGYSDLANNRAPGGTETNADLAANSRIILEGVDRFVAKENRVQAMRMILEFEDGRPLDETVVRSLVENLDKAGFKVDHSDWETAGVTSKRQDKQITTEIPNIPKLEEIQRAHAMQGASMSAALQADAPKPTEPSVDTTPPAEATAGAPSPEQGGGEIPTSPIPSEPPAEEPPASDKTAAPENTSSAVPTSPESQPGSEQDENDALAQLRDLRAGKARSGTPVSELVSKAKEATAAVNESKKRGGLPDRRQVRQARFDRYARLSGAE